MKYILEFTDMNTSDKRIDLLIVTLRSTEKFCLVLVSYL